MNKLLPLFFALFVTFGSPADNINKKYSQPPLIIGLLPYLSPNLLIKTWHPLLDHLEQQLDRKIIVKTAPDFAVFIDRTRKQRYDLVLTAPHFAALAHSEGNYIIVAGFSKKLRGDIVVAYDSPYRSLKDLHSKSLATPDQLSIITFLAEQYFEQAKLIKKSTGTIKHYRSHNNALISVLENKADVAVAISGLAYNISITTGRPKLFRYLGKTKSSPHLMFMVKHSLSTKESDQITRALIQTNKTSAGVLLLYKLGWGAIKYPDADEIEYLARFLPLLEQRLKK